MKIPTQKLTDISNNEGTFVKFECCPSVFILDKPLQDHISQHHSTECHTPKLELQNLCIFAPFRLLTDLRDANSWEWAPPSTPQVANKLWTTTSQPSTGCCKSFSNSKLKIEKNDTTAQFPSCPYSSWFFKDMSLANFAPNLRNKLEYRGPANRGAQALNSTAPSTRVSSHGWLYWSKNKYIKLKCI